MRTALWLVISNVALSYHSFGEVSRVFEKFFVSSFCAVPSSPPAGTGISLKSVEKHGIIFLSLETARKKRCTYGRRFGLSLPERG